MSCPPSSMNCDRNEGCCDVVLANTVLCAHCTTDRGRIQGHKTMRSGRARTLVSQNREL
jgi:hypothetical protein